MERNISLKTLLHAFTLWLAPLVTLTWLAPSGLATEERPVRKSLLIVTPSRFEEALQPLVEHKRATGPVEIVALETILAKSQGVDEAEKLKRYLYGAWKNRGLHFVLLVGDADVLPVRYMVLDRITEAAFDYAFYPSDLYYADVAKRDSTFDDWNRRKESFHAGYFGEVRGEKNKEDPINYYYEKERLAELKPTESWYPASIFFQGMKFMVFGDPSLRLPR